MARRKLDVNGRTVFVTGAARGIGGGVAERLHSKGANVALVGLEPDLLEERAAKLGDRAAWFEADVTDTEALDRAVAGTVERFGGIDVAVANAGIHTVGSLITAPPEQIERTINVNLFGVWRTDRAVLPHVLARKGYLLNIASMAAAAHAPLMGPYAASKAGVEGLTNSLRMEMYPTGARAGCAYFGFIDTDLVKASFEQPTTKILEGNMPAFIRKPVPVSDAVDAIERGIERRSARVWAPRFVGGALAIRGIMQPLTEIRMMRSKQLAEAIRLADPANGGLDGQDPILGVAASVSEREKVGA
ncbi:MAG TPA: short-chain dehydrogenase/reductase [Solirubrobacterales bacterium]|nr:short-chain dehydrogenase/reductase [Solirubrobacterales bacterium]